ncbi:MAG: hypothetical protein ABL900_20085, partial [Burkholderiaceae bacterium]
MSNPTIATLLKYVNLQMAAEAIFEPDFAGPIPASELTDGNNRASRFTPTQAAQFISDGWIVLAHQFNTATGFSGTLFKNTQTNELVLSFRSTEFADDAARDTQATGKMEINPHGWAFGQIADMKTWFDQLNAAGGPLAAGQSFAVTGYSLGGHLATAFSQLGLGSGRVTGTYTFNGAGVGSVNAGASLAQTIDLFQQRRTQGSAAEFTRVQIARSASTDQLGADQTAQSGA